MDQTEILQHCFESQARRRQEKGAGRVASLVVNVDRELGVREKRHAKHFVDKPFLVPFRQREVTNKD